MIRSIKRNIIKQRIGSNNIKDIWHALQVKKFGGLSNYREMRRKNKEKR